MRFEWDETKRELNLTKHGLDFHDAATVFEDPHALDLLDARFSDERWLIVGHLNQYLVVIAYEQRTGDIIRVISMRLATRQEKKKYDRHIASLFEKMRQEDEGL